MRNIRDQGAINNLIIVSQNVRRLRGSLSQAEFGKKVGVSRATIHRIESLKNFEVISLFKIADALGLRRHDLVLTEEERLQLQCCADTGVPTGSFKEILKKEIIAELKKEQQNGKHRKPNRRQKKA